VFPEAMKRSDYSEEVRLVRFRSDLVSVSVGVSGVSLGVHKIRQVYHSSISIQQLR
jgi:hypothetical protein